MRLISSVIILAVFTASNSYATKPCPVNVCAGEPFNESLCVDKSDWVAVGTIDILNRVNNGYPLNNISYTFAFHPNYFVKGKHPAYELVFITGWCENRIFDVLSSGQTIMIYGLYQRDHNTENGSFLHYRITERR